MVINAVLFCAFQHSSLQIDKIHLQIVLFEERHIAADFLFFFVSLQAEQIKLYMPAFYWRRNLPLCTT